MLYRLKEAGYEAFLVGGAVRDLLLGITPKDFDVATNALPEEVRRLFRNCRLIGRPFRLAHVHFGSEIIEVATFRAAAAPEREDAEDGEDAERPRPGPVEDLYASIARSIPPGASCATTSTARSKRTFGGATSPPTGSTTTSRISRSGISSTGSADVQRAAPEADRRSGDALSRGSGAHAAGRALRGQARFLDRSRHRAADPASWRNLLDGVPPARLFDECLKLFLSGFGAKSFALLQQYGLFEHLFPMSAAAFDLPPYAYAREMLELGLANTDARILADKPVTPTFLFAIAAVERGAARAQRAAGGTRAGSRAAHAGLRCGACGRSSRASRFRADSPCRCASC